MKIRRHAFTLIEMLLVVAIISLLAGLAFAAMGPSRESARQRVCVSNFHQIGQSFAMYIADYDGVEVAQGQPMQYDQLGLPSLRMAPKFMDTYIKNRQVLLCPDYHGSVPIDKLTTTYSWIPDDDEHGSGRYKFSNIVASRGGDTPLLTDEEHNPPFNLQKEPRWTIKRVIVLRLNQQVQIKQVPIRSTYESW